MFLSTPPVWVATGPVSSGDKKPIVSIHATRVGGDVKGLAVTQKLIVSIHATRVGGDLKTWICWVKVQGFLSTPPVWVATIQGVSEVDQLDVSIHATRVGGDIPSATPPVWPSMFLSTPPVWVATQGVTRVPHYKIEFLSTPPVWVATQEPQDRGQDDRGFYPRHPCGWRPSDVSIIIRPKRRFYPRHPCGWRPLEAAEQAAQLGVSIHATRVGGDPHSAAKQVARWMFLSTPPVWVATGVLAVSSTKRLSFYPRHPCGWRQLGFGLAVCY